MQQAISRFVRRWINYISVDGDVFETARRGIVDSTFTVMESHAFKKTWYRHGIRSETVKIWCWRILRECSNTTSKWDAVFRSQVTTHKVVWSSLDATSGVVYAVQSVLRDCERSSERSDQVLTLLSLCLMWDSPASLRSYSVSAVWNFVMVLSHSTQCLSVCPSVCRSGIMWEWCERSSLWKELLVSIIVKRSKLKITRPNEQ